MQLGDRNQGIHHFHHDDEEDDGGQMSIISQMYSSSVSGLYNSSTTAVQQAAVGLGDGNSTTTTTTTTNPKPRRRRKKTAPKNSDGSDTSPLGFKKRKLSDEQVNLLEKHFGCEHKLESERKDRLASELGLDPRQVAVWFQNRRARWKNKKMEEEYSKLKSQHDAAVLQKCHLESELLKTREQLLDAQKEIQKLSINNNNNQQQHPPQLPIQQQQEYEYVAAAATSTNSPSSSMTMEHSMEPTSSCGFNHQHFDLLDHQYFENVFYQLPDDHGYTMEYWGNAAPGLHYL